MNKDYIKPEKNKKILKNVGNSGNGDCYSISKEENPFQKKFWGG